MDALRALVAAKKRQLEDVAIDSKGSKIIKMADVMRKREEERKPSKPAVEATPIVETKVKKTAEEMADASAELPRPEVIRRLRLRNAPVRLFGESDRDALRRLRRMEIEQPDMNLGWQNDFQSALNKVDEDFIQEVIKDKSAQHDVNVPAQNEETWDKLSVDVYELSKNAANANRDCDVIHSFIVHILKKWGRELNARPAAEKQSPRGKLEAGTHRQTMENLKPLMAQLKAHSCNHDIRCHLCNIVKLCVIEKDYVKANTAYMEMAIGNAPWPVGVTRSGIHQRPGSAKAYVSNIAHVLNDETQRKYIHGIKRIITKCQDYYATDPSKCVEYVKKQI